MFVFLVLSMLYPNNRICEGHEDLPSSCKAVLDVIKFEEKPSCVEMDFSESEYFLKCGMCRIADHHL